MVGPEVFFSLDRLREAATAGDLLLGGLSAGGTSGAEDTLVFGVGTLEEGGEGLLLPLSKDPLDPNDWKINFK